MKKYILQILSHNNTLLVFHKLSTQKNAQTTPYSWVTYAFCLLLIELKKGQNLLVCLSVASVTMCEYDCQPFLLYKKYYTRNKHLFQSFYAFKIKFLFSLDYPQQKRKSPVKSLATIGGTLHPLLSFLFAVSSRKRKKVTRPHHQTYQLSTVVSIVNSFKLGVETE